jgi:sugar-specific transcriptional regulator TrmB
MKIEDIKRIGLTEYEAKSYVALLIYGSMPGRDVAQRSGVPPTRVFDALKALMDKGFVFLISQKPMMFQAIKPEIAVRSFVDKKVESLEGLKSTTIDLLKMLETSVPEEKVEEKIFVISGFEKMYSVVNANTAGTKKELLVFSVGEKIPYSTETALRKAVKRGVKFRFIASRYDKDNAQYVQRLKSIGASVRYYKAENYSIAIFDKRIVNIVVKSPSNPKERITTIFDNKDLGAAMAQWFENIWKKAKPIK